MRAIVAVLLIGVVASLAMEADVDSEAEMMANAIFAPDTAATHKTASYRNPVAPRVILRRNQPIVVVVPGATACRLVSSRNEVIELTVTAHSPTGVTVIHTEGALGFFSFVVMTGANKAATVSVIMIANPYVEKDETFIGFTATNNLFPPDMAEHVQNEKGALWQGSSRSFNWIPWAYNHYDLSVLETTAELIDSLSIKQRASTALVVRYLTSQSSLVLRGRWDGQYSDGKQPGFWASTTQIIAQYRQTSKRVVKYGQCWVFAGLLTGLCRSMGIPARPLTNFDSAHEHQPFDQKCNTDYKKTANGYERVSADNSIWNFHVWVDAWMRRPDIAGNGGDGWQAIDATPQEESSGPNEAPFANSDYRCGPASHNQIWAMQTKGDYDVAFVAGEANCLKVDSVDGKEVSRDPNTVGETMITKSPDKICKGIRMDDTNYNTVCRTNLARVYSKAGSFLEVARRFHAGQYKVSLPTSEVRLGKRFTISIGPSLASDPSTEYSIILTAVSYNSEHQFGVIKSVHTVGSAATVTIEAADWGKDFLKSLVPLKTLTLDAVMVATPKTGKPYLKRVMIPVHPPKLAMLCGSKKRVSRNDKIACNVQFRNPLPYPITDAVMSFSMSGQKNSEQTVKAKGQIAIELNAASANAYDTVARNVGAHDHSSFGASFVLNGAIGKQIIIAKFSSKELDGVSGVMEIEITP